MNMRLDFDSHPFRLILFSGLFLLIFKFFFSSNYGAIFLNSMLEFIILAAICLAAFFAEGLLPEDWKKSKGAIWASFYLLVAVNFLIFAINSIYLDESLLMKYTLSNVNLGIFGFLMKSIVPFHQLIMLPALFALICLASFANISLLKKAEPHIPRFIAVMTVLTLGFLAFNFGMFSNVYANTVHERLFDDSRSITLGKGAVSEAAYDAALFDKSIKNYDSISIPQNQKVLIFIFEQASYQTFKEDLAKIPAERNFFEKVKPHTQVFTNFYTSNQDSITAIWGILDSQFIPFESYMDDWNKYFGSMLESGNLVDLFNENNYSTYVAVSDYQPDLWDASYNWSEFTYLKDSDVDAGNLFCLGNLEYAQGCEDNAIKEEVKNALREHKSGNLFFIQEFIYGHGEEYMQAVGKTRTEYYNDYLLDVYDFMEKEGLLENTTIVVVADHGEKGYSEKSLWNYQIPFMVIREDQGYREINGLYSSIDTKDILLSYMNNEEIKKGNDFYFFMGQTQSSEMGYVDAQGNYLLAKVYGDEVHLREINGSGMDEKKAGELMAMFLKYQSDFHGKSLQKDYQCGQCAQHLERVREYQS